jgi:hypothetical protein
MQFLAFNPHVFSKNKQRNLSKSIDNYRINLQFLVSHLQVFFSKSGCERVNYPDRVFNKAISLAIYHSFDLSFDMERDRKGGKNPSFLEAWP